MNNLERTFERMLWRSRMVVLMGVVANLLHSFAAVRISYNRGSELLFLIGGIILNGMVFFLSGRKSH